MCLWGGGHSLRHSRHSPNSLSALVAAQTDCKQAHLHGCATGDGGGVVVVMAAVWWW